MPYWDDDPTENVYMEITTRANIGENLLVPESKVGPGSSPSIRLASSIEPGDIIVHYKSDEQAIVGVSRVVGEPEETTFDWQSKGARDRSGKHRGVEVRLDGFTLLASPVRLADIRALEREILTIRGELERMHPDGEPLHFPWAPYKGQALRTTLAYLAKVPRSALSLFPTIESAADALLSVGTLLSTPNDEWREVVDNPSIAPAGGPGRHSDDPIEAAEIDRGLRMFAINLAGGYFDAEGWAIEIASAGDPFDFIATRSGQSRYVFTLGSTDQEDEIVMEDDVAEFVREHPNSVLVAVTDLSVERFNDRWVETTSDVFTFIDPWEPTLLTVDEGSA